MEDRYPFTTSEEERAQRRAQRIADRRRRQREQRIAMLKRLALAGAAVLVLLAVILLVMGGKKEEGEAVPTVNEVETVPPETVEPPEVKEPEPAPAEPEIYHADKTASTLHPGEEIDSDYAILIDLQSGTVIAEKNSDTVISPASILRNSCRPNSASKSLRKGDSSITFIHSCSNSSISGPKSSQKSFSSL